MLSDKTLSVIVSLLQQQKGACKMRMMASIEERKSDMMFYIEKYQQVTDAVEDFDAFLDELGITDVKAEGPMGTWRASDEAADD